MEEEVNVITKNIFRSQGRHHCVGLWGLLAVYSLLQIMLYEGDHKENLLEAFFITFF